MRFQEYSIADEIKRNLESMGFKRPTDIQFKSIPPILRKEDVLAIAQTGTGKTAAFAIPIIHLLHEKKRKVKNLGIQCIVLAPTRELALQITKVFNQLEKGSRVTSISIFGGVEQDPQINKLLEGVDVLVATPGRVFDLQHQGYIKLANTSIIVLDEADHMLDLGFIQDIRDLSRYLPKERQTLFFSATINDEIKKLAYSLVTNPIRIQIAPKERVSKNIDHSKFFVKADEKRFFLERIIKEHEDKKIIVFVRTKVRAERVSKAMERAFIDTMTLHGDKDQKDRFDVLDKFRKGICKVLIATDVSARGIDIPNVDYVVNYDLPDVAENYVHRVGRTGRGTQYGIAVSFCSEEENELLVEIEAFLTKPIVEIKIDLSDYKKTIDFTEDSTTYDLNLLMKEVEEFESVQKKKAKSKKIKK